MQQNRMIVGTLLDVHAGYAHRLVAGITRNLPDLSLGFLAVSRSRQR